MAFMQLVLTILRRHYQLCIIWHMRIVKDVCVMLRKDNMFDLSRSMKA